MKTTEEDLRRLAGDGESDPLGLARLADIGLSFAAVVHEARQPLAAMRMAVQLLLDAIRGNAEAERLAIAALDQVGRLDDIMDRARDLFRPSHSEVSEVDVAAALRGALVLARSDIERQGVSIETDVAPEAGTVQIERFRLEHVLHNLLANARDALAAQGGGRIVVMARPIVPVGVEIVVADDGPGVDPAVADRIFDPFITTKGGGKGMGLGLYVSKRLVTAAGGTIRLLDAAGRAALGRGDLSTAFSVVLPRKATGRLAAETVRPSEAPVVLRALVVDDEDVVRRLMRRLVESEGIECTTVESGEDALSLLERSEFDIVLVDKNLPGINGLEVARVARHAWPELQVIMVTGYASTDSAEEAAAMGVADYVVKPIDVDDFRNRLRRAARRASALQRDRGRLTRPQEASTVPPARRPTPPPDVASDEELEAEDNAGIEIGLSVLVVHPDDLVRGGLSETLSGLGCRVAAFATARHAAPHARLAGFDVLVAPPDVLRQSGQQLLGLQARRLAGAVAIMDRSGVDRAIEAIHLGARGVFSPPFEASRVAREIRKVAGYLLEERRRSDEPAGSET